MHTDAMMAGKWTRSLGIEEVYYLPSLGEDRLANINVSGDE